MKRLLAVLAALVLTGCSSLPTSGPVHTAQPQIPAGYGIDVLAEGPAADAGPEEIVHGFLRASAYGHTDDFQIASQYLASGTEWNPAATVHVYSSDSSPTTAVDDDGGISITVSEVATVDGLGRYRIAGNTPLTSTYTLVRERGEWRIAALPDGIVVSDVNFQQTFGPAQIHFLTHDFLSTVPEQRWYPLDSRVSHLVEGLLAGPSGWMEFGVTSAFPPETALDGPVTVADGVVVIPLTDQFLGANPQEVGLAYAQLEATLARITDVTSVRIEVNRSEIERPDFDVELELPQPSPGPILVSGGQLSRYVGGTFQRVPGAPDLAAREPRHPAMPYAESDAPAVVVADDGSALVAVPTDGSDPVTLATGDSFVPPSYDRYGWIWTGEQRNEGRLRVVRPDGVFGDIGASWLAGRTVSHVRVASDGARAAVVSSQDGTTYVELVGISRDNLGRPRAVGDPLRVAEGITKVSDIDWVDQTSLVVLGSTTADGALRVHRVQIGGPTTVLPAVEGAVALASNRTERSVVVADTDGYLWVRSGAGWRWVVTGVQDPAYSG